MDEDDVFALLDGGVTSNKDRRHLTNKNPWIAYIGDSTGIEIEAFGATKEEAWDNACKQLREILAEREAFNNEEHPSETPGERNPGLGR